MTHLLLLAGCVSVIWTCICKIVTFKDEKDSNKLIAYMFVTTVFIFLATVIAVYLAITGLHVTE